MKNNFRSILIVIILILSLGFSVTSTDTQDLTLILNAYLDTPTDTIDWWPMFQHDLGTTGNTSAYGPSTPSLLWSYTTGFHIVSSPSIMNHQVYIGSDDEQFYCLNASTGSLIWQKPIPGGTSICQPAVVNNLVYMGTTYDYVYCWNAHNGNQIWKFNKGYGGMSSPSVVNDKVYIGKDRGMIYCLNAQTGGLIWDYDFGFNEVSPTAYSDGKVYIGSEDHLLYCFDADNGDVLWTFDTGYLLLGGPTIVNDKIFCGGASTYCLDADTGGEYWSYPVQSLSSPAVAYGKLYTKSSNGRIYCLDAASGALLWEYMVSDHEWSFSSPAVAHDLVYVGAWSNGNLICLDALTGEFVWSYPVSPGNPGHLFSSPTVADGRVYMGGGISQKVYAFEDPSLPPDIPSIEGPFSGELETLIEFTAETTDPDGNLVYYKWYWDDGAISDWLGPYPSGQSMVASHQWNSTGIYSVKVRTKDEFHVYSRWSDPHSIEIILSNQPPDIPTIDGPKRIRVSKMTSFTFTACDPEDQELYYYIDWDDGSYEDWFGPYLSGESIVIDHKWDEQGNYTIRAKAKDTMGEVSDWGYLEVTMRMNQQSQNWWFLQFLQNHPRMFPILRLLLEL